MTETEAGTVADREATGRSERKRIWIFDRPLWRDWLLWLALAGGIASALVVFNGERWYRTSTTPGLTFALAFVIQFVLGVFVVAVVVGIVREFMRGRREGPDVE